LARASLSLLQVRVFLTGRYFNFYVVWGNGQAPAVNHQPQTIAQTFELPIEQQKPLRAEGRDKSPKTIAQICQEIGIRSRTTIDASTSSKTRCMTFILRGRPADVVEAKRQLWAEVAQLMSSPCEVPEEHLGAIIGTAGRNLQALMAETGTKINIPKKEGYPGHIIITGDYDAIAECKARIQAVVEERSKKIVERVELKAHLLPFVFGMPPASLGEQVQSWADRYSIKVSHEVNRETDSAQVVFSGDRDEVCVAHAEFMRLLEEQKRLVKSVSTSVPKALHRFLIGSKRSVLNDLEADSGCSITIPTADSPSDHITLFGPQEKLLKGLSAVMEKSGSMSSEVVNMPAQVRTLLHEKHAGKIDELQAIHDVVLSLVEGGIQVNGLKGKVTSFLADFEALLKPLV